MATTKEQTVKQLVTLNGKLSWKRAKAEALKLAQDAEISASQEILDIVWQEPDKNTSQFWEDEWEITVTCVVVLKKHSDINVESEYDLTIE